MNADEKYMAASLEMRSAISDFIQAAELIEKDKESIADDIADAMMDGGIKCNISVESN